MDPQKVVTQEEAIVLDIPLGLITVRHDLSNDCTGATDYNSRSEVKIGVDQSISARYFEEINNNNVPNPAYIDAHVLTYCFQNKYTTISYVSHFPENNLETFFQILSTFQFLLICLSTLAFGKQIYAAI